MNVDKIRNDFPILNEKMSNKPLIYFDNSATSLKPKAVVNSITDYYTKYSTNAHRGDYDLSFIVDKKYEESRQITADFINASTREVVFTSGTTEGINIVVKSFFEHTLKAGDEVILDYAEHASNVLPWYNLVEKIGIKIIFMPLTDEGFYTVDNLKQVVTEKTKVIALAHVTNTLADVREVEEICAFANNNSIYTVIDGAQSIPHKKCDVKKINCDFFVFSAHKMCGPTGIGVLYGKADLLEAMSPYNQGGGMNARFNREVEVSYKSIPTVFEAGTQNIAGVLGLGSAIKYLEQIGMDNIELHEQKLKKYAVEQLKNLSNIKLYNEHTTGGVVLFNVIDNEEIIFPQDVAAYLNTYGIAVRAGDHCAKLLDNVTGERVTCRASFYLYNTIEEIDTFIDALKNCNSESVILF